MTGNPLEGLTVQEPARRVKPSGKPVSDKQRSLILSLMDERDTSGLKHFPHGEDDDIDAFVDGLIGGWGGSASQLIDDLFAAPYQGAAEEPAETDLPGPGYFGVDGKRYVIDRPDTGKWAGWLFLKTGSDYHDQQRLGSVKPGGPFVESWRGGSYKGRATEVFQAIQADEQAAREEYARITGRCYACNRKLEDPLSVSLGIGPVCRAGGGSTA